MKKIDLESWQLPRELRFLLDVSLQRAAEIPAELDWEYFDRLVSQHRIQPLLIRGLRQLGSQCPPELAKYRTQQNRFAMQSMERIQALAAINAAFAQAGIRMITMKGPLLAMELYGDPSMRTSRDLDLMVAQEDLDRAGELLVQMGYELEEHLYLATPLRRKFYSMVENEKHRVYNRGEICIELHWQTDYQRQQSFEELWTRREERPLLGRPIALMGADDRYPALIVHAVEHGFLRLRWLLDLYELQKKPGFSWERVFDLMEAQGLGSVLLETILVMYRLDLPGLPEVDCRRFRVRKTDTGVELETDADLKIAERAEKLCDAVYPLLLRPVMATEPEWKAYDALLPRAVYGKTALQWILTVLGPTELEYAWIDMPDWVFWLYFLIRPINWVRRKVFGGK